MSRAPGSAGPARPGGTSGSSAEEVTPGEVRPQRVPGRIAHVTKTEPTRRLRPGDLVCGQCGEGNAPTRKFCSRCGEELTTAAVVRSPWWRRLVFWRRGPRILEAGTRPGRGGAKTDGRARLKRGYRKVRATVASVLLVLTMVSLFVPSIRGELNDRLGDPGGRARDLWGRWFDPNYVPITPSTHSATHETPGHTGDMAVDRDKQTFWAAPRNRRVKRPAVTVGFDGPVTLTHIVVTSGATGADFNKYYRPKALHLVYGANASEDIVLADVAEDQVFELQAAEGVTSLKIYVAGVHPETTATQVALTELEFKVLDE